MLKRLIFSGAVVVLYLLVACSAKSIEAKFLHGDRNPSSQVVKLEKLPLEDQYKIFTYGNQEMHPPHKWLSRPIAKRGKPALDYVLEQIRDSENDLDFRDSLVIFREMESQGYYGVCEDESAMQEITANKDRIEHKDWRAIYRQMLESLC